MLKKMLDAAIGTFLHTEPASPAGTGVIRAMERLDARRLDVTKIQSNVDFAGMEKRRLDSGKVRAKRWVKAHPGKKPSEAPRHIRENAGL